MAWQRLTLLFLGYVLYLGIKAIPSALRRVWPDVVVVCRFERRILHLQQHNHMTRRLLSSAAIVALTVVSLGGRVSDRGAQEQIHAAQDVELGQKAAAEARQQLPIMRDDAVTSYVERLGQRLAAIIPATCGIPNSVTCSTRSTSARSTRSRCPAGRCSSTAA